jgi:2-oxoglutarate dehydrogenase complex dehydrogenase (E1) component-like enzyme
MLDIYGYRKYGHNEVDEPSFTQPIMYNNIRNVHQAIPLKYTSQLAKEGLVDASFYDQTREKIFKHYEEEYRLSLQIKQISMEDFLHPHTQGSPRSLTQQWKHMKPSQFGK